MIDKHGLYLLTNGIPQAAARVARLMVRQAAGSRATSRCASRFALSRGFNERTCIAFEGQEVQCREDECSRILEEDDGPEPCELKAHLRYSGRVVPATDVDNATASHVSCPLLRLDEIHARNSDQEHS